MEENEEITEVDLKNVLKFFLKNLWIIFAVSVLSAGIALLSVINFIPKRYKSSVKLYVNTGMSISNISITGLEAGSKLVDRYIVILESSDTLQSVKNKAKSESESSSLKQKIDSLEIKELQEMITATDINGTDIFKVSVTDTIPERAYALVSAIGEILGPSVDGIIDGASTKLVESASEPEQVSPRTVRTTVIFFFVGAFVSIAVLFIAFLLDKKIHDEQYIIDNNKYPLLAVVPDLTKSSESKYGKYGKYKYGGKYGYYSQNSNNEKGENGNV